MPTRTANFTKIAKYAKTWKIDQVGEEEAKRRLEGTQQELQIL